jgi:uncharacterized membrane protein
MIKFDQPLYLIFLVLAVWVVWSMRQLFFPPFRKFVIVFGRLLLLLSTLAILSQMHVSWTSTELHVVFLVDRSESLSQSHQAEMNRYLADELERTPLKTHVTVISFGRVSHPEGLSSLGPVPYMPPAALPLNIRSSTNLQRALELAGASLPSYGRRRIVLISDCQENQGAARVVISKLKKDGVTIDVRLMDNGLAGDVIVEDIEMKGHVTPEEPFNIQIPLILPKDTEGVLKVWIDGQLRTEQKMTVPKGHQRLKVAEKLKDAGGHRIEVAFEVEGDPRQRNNRSMGYIKVQGQGPVLLLSTHRGARHIRASLEESSIPVTVVQSLPSSLAELDRYSAIVVVDIPAVGMSRQDMENVRSYVENLGGGFVMLGSPNTFASGGYYETPIEDILPVHAKPKTEKKYGSHAQILVVDQSGSMGAPASGFSSDSKMDLANQGAAAVISLLYPQDLVGVNMVDTASSWVVEMQRVATEVNRANMINNVLSNQPGGGGIYCYQGLRAAYDEMLSKAGKATTKHVILYADGADAEEQNGCVALVRAMVNSGITVSTVSLGRSHDTPFLQNLAENVGQGRFYLTESGADVKSIFTRETSLASKRSIIEAPIASLPFMPSTLWSWKKGPALTGYVITEGKTGADVILISNYTYEDKDKPAGNLQVERKFDPILATWRVGLGRSLAFTADLAGQLSADFISSEEFREFWPRCIRWIRRSPVNSRISTQLDPKTGRLDMVALDGDIPQGLKVMVTTEKGRRELRLNELGPQMAESQIDLSETGTYVIDLIDSEGQILGHSTHVVQSGQELRRPGPHLSLATYIGNETSGLVFTGKADVFRKEGQVAHKMEFPLFLYCILAVVGLLIDISGRRFPALVKIKIENTKQSLMPESSAPKRKLKEKPKTINPAALAEVLKEEDEEETNTEKPPETPEEDITSDELLKRRKRRNR